jgi:hypothetical protein
MTNDPLWAELNARDVDEGSGDYFGRCPICGSAGTCLNVRKVHWFVCLAHQVKWCYGENLFSTWRFEDEATWDRHAQFLDTCREVTPDHGDAIAPEPWRHPVHDDEDVQRWLLCGPDPARPHPTVDGFVYCSHRGRDAVVAAWLYHSKALRATAARLGLAPLEDGRFFAERILAERIADDARGR